MKNFIKKMIGLDKLEEAIAKAEELKTSAEQQAQKVIDESNKAKKEAQDAAKRAKKEAQKKEAELAEVERLAKLDPKERATEQKLPYIAVLETHVNEQNPRNGFFELDWNEYFVLQLKAAGYYGETDEEVVNRWFQDLCRDIGSEQGVDMDRRGSGYINVTNIGNGKSEIS